MNHDRQLASQEFDSLAALQQWRGPAHVIAGDVAAMETFDAPGGRLGLRVWYWQEGRESVESGS